MIVFLIPKPGLFMAKYDIFNEIIVSQQQIISSVENIASEVKKTYADNEKVLAFVMLMGAKWFADDLFRAINDYDKFQIRYIRASSYQGGTKSTGQVTISPDIKENLSGKEILIIDDIYDSGLTLKTATELFKEKGASDIKTCVLLEKQIEHKEQINVDFVGLNVPNEFIVGYGLDYNQMYRELPFIASIKENIIHSGELPCLEDVILP